MQRSETIGALAAALAKAQGQMTFASKDATNPHFRSKYANLAAVVEAIREPLSSNGLSFSQLCDFTESGGLIVETVLMHESGEWISGRLNMPVPKMDPQGVGSALTYSKRYSLASIVGIAADEDDDGEGAMGRGKTDGNASPERYEKGKQSSKSGAQGANANKPIVEPTTARIDLYNELGQIFHGREDEMADALRNYSVFKGKEDKDVFLTLKQLETPTDNEKMHKWFASTLEKLRKDSARG